MTRSMRRSKGVSIIYIATILALVLFFGSCRGKKSMVKKELKITQSDDLIRNVSKQELDYQTIEIKSSTKADLEGRNYSLNITYRNKKNETIWISVRAMLGIEAARLIANQDSVWVISKIARTKEKGTWKDMSKMIGYPLDFMAFQSIMTRKVFYPGQENKRDLNGFVQKEDGRGLLLVTDYGNDKYRKDAEEFGFMPQFVIDKNSYQLNSTRLTPEDSDWLLEVNYQEGSFDNMGLGKNMLIKALDSQSKQELDLKIQQVTVDGALKMPFQWF